MVELDEEFNDTIIKVYSPWLSDADYFCVLFMFESFWMHFFFFFTVQTLWGWKVILPRDMVTFAMTFGQVQRGV